MIYVFGFIFGFILAGIAAFAYPSLRQPPDFLMPPSYHQGYAPRQPIYETPVNDYQERGRYR